VTLSKEEVLALPTVRFGMDDFKDVMRKYRGDGVSDGDGDNCLMNDAQMKGESKRIDSLEMAVEEAEVTEETAISIDTHDSKEDTSSNNSNAMGVDIGADIDNPNNPNDEDNASIQKQDSDFIRAAFDSCVMCSICICEFEEGEELRLLPECGHVFHTDCISPWLTEKRNTCPLCQQKVMKEEDNEQGGQVPSSPSLSIVRVTPSADEAEQASENRNRNRNDESNPNVSNRNGDVEEGVIRNLFSGRRDASNADRQLASIRMEDD